MSVRRHEVNEQRAFFHESRLDSFSKICSDALEKQAPLKKDVCEQITNLSLTPKSRKRSKLKNYFLKKRSD